VRLQSPFGVVTASVDGDVLRVLASADAWFTIPTIASLIGNRTSEGVRKSVRRLHSEGIIDQQAAGRASLFRLNREHLAAPSIIALADLRAAFLEKLKTELHGWPEPPAFAAIFGSAARGDMRADSDIDLFFLKPHGVNEGTWAGHIDGLVEQASRWTGNDIRPLIYSVDEISAVAMVRPILRSIVAEGIPLIGDKFWFQRLVDDNEPEGAR
jgi:hypothetical protein